MLGLSISYFLLAWSGHLDARVGWFVGIAMGMSLANGVGSGILMTLGADLAPRDDPAPFLGAWRFTGDFGSAAAPLVISGVTAVATIAVASGVMGVLGLIGAGVLLRYVPGTCRGSSADARGAYRAPRAALPAHGARSATPCEVPRSVRDCCGARSEEARTG